MSEREEFISITNEMLPILKKTVNLTDLAFSIWFCDIELIHLTDEKAVFLTHSAMRQKIISNKYKNEVANALEAVIGFKVEVEIGTDEETVDYAQVLEDRERDLHESQTPVGSVPKEEEEVDVGNAIENLINGKEPSLKTTETYTFNNFIVGSSNKFAKAACEAVAKEPCTYNPLFIYGHPGLGKTHLLYAVTHYIKKYHRNLRFVYKKCETFMNELIEAINEGTTHEFKEKYRSADVLLIDDIQFIAGKEATQEEFFHTFSALYELDKQIILTSDRPPKEIKPLEDRLRTRFESGLIADINPPDLELRIAIIKKKSAQMGFEIPQDMIQYLAERLRDNVRQIEGVLKRLYALVNFSGEKFNKTLVDSTIAIVDPGNMPTEVIIEKAMRLVCKKYNVTEDDLKSTKRTQNIANARHVAIYLLKRVTELSNKDVGNIFNRNHSTVNASLTLVDINIKTKKNFGDEMNELLSNFKTVNPY